MNIKKIISGGQTGVDRAALNADLSCGFPAGGWCPEGRKAEDGVIPQVIIQFKNFLVVTDNVPSAMWSTVTAR